MVAHILSLEISGKIGIGTIVTITLALVGAVWLVFKWNQGDPSEWRENYLGEVARREELEKRVASQDDHIRTLEEKIRQLEQARSLEPVLAALQKNQETSEGMLKILQLLAERLAPAT